MSFSLPCVLVLCVSSWWTGISDDDDDDGNDGDDDDDDDVVYQYCTIEYNYSYTEIKMKTTSSKVPQYNC